MWVAPAEHGAKAPGVKAAGKTRHSNVAPDSEADIAHVKDVAVVVAPSSTPESIVVSGAIASIENVRTTSVTLPALSVARTVST